MDVWGPFAVHGTLIDKHFSFLKEYAERQYGNKITWRYEGSVNGDLDEISGHWGSPDSEAQTAQDLVKEDEYQDFGEPATTHGY